MAFCCPLGIPHSIFLGRVVGPGEPYWLPDDQDKAIAFTRAERELCPNCHTRRSDWVDDKGELRSPPPFEPIVDRCPACAELERVRVGVRESAIRDEPGVYVALAPYDPDRGPLTLPDPEPPGDFEGEGPIPGRRLGPS